MAQIFPEWMIMHLKMNVVPQSMLKHRFQIIVAGEISLGGDLRPENLDGRVTKGNVYLDGHPICDDGWSREDAAVACR